MVFNLSLYIHLTNLFRRNLFFRACRTVTRKPLRNVTLFLNRQNKKIFFSLWWCKVWEHYFFLPPMRLYEGWDIFTRGRFDWKIINYLSKWTMKAFCYHKSVVRHSRLRNASLHTKKNRSEMMLMYLFEWIIEMMMMMINFFNFVSYFLETKWTRFKSPKKRAVY